MRKRAIFGMALLWAGITPAQQQELALTLGGVARDSRQSLELGRGTAFGANYATRLVAGQGASLYLEVQLLASPLRDVQAANRAATRDFATLYLTPGLRVKLLPGSRVSPFVAIGGGYALYENSVQRIDGLANEAPRFVHRAAFTFGGGVDMKAWRFIGLRGEVRDYYSGNPAFNIPVRGRQHNVVVSGGFVIRWH